jgi:putative component of membrane protein insertase Oxa1/YidC/SpoIIIJ protein YidD
MSLASRWADSAIGWYQTRLSPRKGWGCAHRVAHGGPSCSAAVRDLVARRGAVRAVAPSALRFLACWHASQLLATSGVSGVCCCGPIPVPFRFGGRS